MSLLVLGGYCASGTRFNDNIAATLYAENVRAKRARRIASSVTFGHVTPLLFRRLNNCVFTFKFKRKILLAGSIWENVQWPALCLFSALLRGFY